MRYQWRLFIQKQYDTITLIRKSEISNNDPPSVQAGLCFTRPEMWDYFCLFFFVFFFETSNKSLKTHFGLHNTLMTLSRLEIRNPG